MDFNQVLSNNNKIKDLLILEFKIIKYLLINNFKIIQMLIVS